MISAVTAAIITLINRANRNQRSFDVIRESQSQQELTKAYGDMKQTLDKLPGKIAVEVAKAIREVQSNGKQIKTTETTTKEEEKESDKT